MIKGNDFDLSASIPDGTERCLITGIDIEKSGRHFTHTLLAIGVATISLSRADVVALRTWCVADPESSVWELRCITEFWSKNVAVLERIKRESLPKAIGLTLFKEYLCRWEAKLEPSKSPTWNPGAILVSDEPTFDTSALDYEMALSKDPDLHGAPLHYTRRTEKHDHQWRTVGDCSERAAALGLTEPFLATFFEHHNVKHDHWPSNDAKKHAWTQVICYAATEYLHRHEDDMTSRRRLLDTFKTCIDDKENGKRFVCNLALEYWKRVIE